MAKRVFTDEQVIEIVGLHKAGKTMTELGQRYGHRPVILQILLGQSYRDVTHHVGACDCPSCQYFAVCDSNLGIAEAAEFVVVQCALCPATPRRRTALVKRAHGHVLCDKCTAGRRA